MLQFVDGGLDRRLADHPKAHPRFLLPVHLPLLAVRTMIPRLQRTMRDFNPACTPIHLRAVAAVAVLRLLLLLLAARATRRRVASPVDFYPGPLQNFSGLLC